MTNSDNLIAMMLFARVVELKSFTEAARVLGVSKSHISRKLPGWNSGWAFGCSSVRLAG